MTIPPLHRGAVSLRPLCADDAPHLLRWLTDPTVLEWYEGRDKPFTAALVQEHFFTADGLSRSLILYEDQPVGYVQVYRLDESEQKEYGCTRAPEPAFAMDQFLGEPACWGKHIGRRFMGLILEHLTTVEHAGAVYVDPHADNERAIRCYESCGFRRVRFMPEHEWHEGQMRDCWIMEYRP